MKKINPDQEFKTLFYKHNFKISNNINLTKIRFWLDENCKGLYGVIKINYWHGEYFSDGLGAFDIVTIEENHEAVLFKTTWM